MKRQRITLLVLALTSLVALVLSACGPAATPIPPTAVPSTATPEPVTLSVLGAVDNELQLTDSMLHAMTVVTLNLEHPKNGPTEYTGVRVNDLLAQAGVKADAGLFTLTASDGYAFDLPLADVQACSDCLLAFDPTTPGAYNAAMAGQVSKAWVKNVVSITLSIPEPVTLTVDGLVDNPLQLTDSALHGMTAATLTLEHPKNGPTEYTGIRLSDLLTQAGIKTGAAAIVFTASDGFTNEIDLATIQACADCMVAFDPAAPGVYNLAMPGQTSGKAWIKAVVAITVK